MKLIVIGMTGNTGSGKSQAAVICKKYGGYIIDADKISHSSIARGREGYNQVVEYFGKVILDDKGNIDRKKLGQIVFQNREKLQKLEAIVHHYVKAESNAQIEALQAEPGSYRFIVVDAPLLIEAGMHETVDQVVVIHSDEKIRLQRIMTRDGISEEAALIRMKNQMPIETMRQYAHVLIENNGDVETLEREIEKLTRMWSSCSMQ